jgi:cytochrome P450
VAEDERARFDPFRAEAIDDPYAQYGLLRAADPVHWNEKLRSWVLFRHDDVVAFLRDDVRLSSDRSKARKFSGPRSDVSPRTVSSDPPEHTPVRAILNACLGPRVRAIGPRVESLIAELIDPLDEAAMQSREVDLIEAFAYPLPIRVIAELLDVPEEERPRFHDLSRAIAAGMDRFYSGSEVNRGLFEIGAYFHSLVEQRRSTSGDDLVRRLLAAKHHGEGLTELEVVAMCTALVFGGHETTVNLIGNGVLALLRHPEELERLRAAPDLVDPAVEELLRFDSPAQLISRTAAQDFELRGRAIRGGDAVLAALGAANRDPEVFRNADRLDVARDPNPHVAFGLGTHFCPGAQLTRIEARAAIRALLARFPRLRLGNASPVRRPTAVLRGLETLPVRLD